MSGKLAKLVVPISVAVSGQNLLKDKQVQTTGLEAERRVLISVTKAW